MCQLACFLPGWLLVRLPLCHPACLPANLHCCLPVHISVYLSTYIPDYNVCLLYAWVFGSMKVFLSFAQRLIVICLSLCLLYAYAFMGLSACLIVCLYCTSLCLCAHLLVCFYYVCTTAYRTLQYMRAYLFVACIACVFIFLHVDVFPRQNNLWTFFTANFCFSPVER